MPPPNPLPVGGNVLSIYDSVQRVPEQAINARPDSLAYQNNGIYPMDAHALGKVSTFKLIGIGCSLIDNPNIYSAHGLRYVYDWVILNNLWNRLSWGQGLTVISQVSIGAVLEPQAGEPNNLPAGWTDQSSFWAWNEQSGGGANTHYGYDLDHRAIPMVNAQVIQILSPNPYTPKSFQLWAGSFSNSGIGTDVSQVSSGDLQPQTPFTIPLLYSAVPLPNPSPPPYAAGITDAIFWLGVGVKQYVAFPA